jgi:integrase
MAIGKITKQAVERMAPGWLWDTACVGFGVRRQRRGCFYYLRYRLGGKQHFASIGRHGSPHTPDTARTEARRLIGEVAQGIDPLLEKHRAHGLGAEIDRYLERKRAQMKPRAYVEVERHLRQHAKPLHHGEVDRRAIATLLGEIETKSGPVARNRTRASLSAFFSWCISEGLRETNPVTGTAKAPEASRERVLTDAELAAIWTATGRGAATDRGAAPTSPFNDIVRLLLLTGQRRDEIGGLRWSEIVGAEIVLPPARTKNKRQHRVPLAPIAAEIIQRQPRRGEFVFANEAGGSFVNWHACKGRLDASLAPPEWHLHDLRRTAATGMASLGILPHIIEAVLNHVSGSKAGVAGIYNRATHEPEKAEALARWADRIEQITRGGGAREVGVAPIGKGGMGGRMGASGNLPKGKLRLIRWAPQRLPDPAATC